MKGITIKLIGLAFFLVLAGPAFALGGSCGGATPCACGDKLIDSRDLVHGLDPITTTVCPGDGLIVDGSSMVLPPNITLNLRSQTIRGSFSLLSVGVKVESYSGLTVTGGQITRFRGGRRWHASERQPLQRPPPPRQR